MRLSRPSATWHAKHAAIELGQGAHRMPLWCPCTIGRSIARFWRGPEPWFPVSSASARQHTPWATCACVSGGIGSLGSDLLAFDEIVGSCDAAVRWRVGGWLGDASPQPDESQRYNQKPGGEHLSSSSAALRSLPGQRRMTALHSLFRAPLGYRHAAIRRDSCAAHRAIAARRSRRRPASKRGVRRADPITKRSL